MPDRRWPGNGPSGSGRSRPRPARRRPTAAGAAGVWLDGEAARGFACDAGITPVVVGEVNLAALDALVRLCQELGGHGPGRCQPRRAPAVGTEGSPGGSGPVLPTER